MARKAVKNLAKRTKLNNEFLTEERSTGGRARRGASTSSKYDRDFKDILREFVASPAFRVAAGGIATALLTRLANNMSDKYPEISNFIRDNLENFEDKIDSFRSSMSGEESTHH